MRELVRVDRTNLVAPTSNDVVRYFVGFPMHMASQGIMEAEVVAPGELYRGGAIGALFVLKEGAPEPEKVVR